ncbi:MAG: hypothetical protein ABL869_06525 [Candidatus Nitrotoga sp.]
MKRLLILCWQQQLGHYQLQLKLVVKSNIKLYERVGRIMIKKLFQLAIVVVVGMTTVDAFAVKKLQDGEGVGAANGGGSAAPRGGTNSDAGRGALAIRDTRVNKELGQVIRIESKKKSQKDR